jgi:hypothetical protein
VPGVYDVRFVFPPGAPTRPATFPPFGARYTFWLDGAIDSCDEFLVHRGVLVRLAAEYGLQLVLWEGFHEYYEQQVDGGSAGGTYRQLLARQRVVDDAGGPSPAEWEVSSLYVVFAFKKTGAA